jgi:ParB-like chromosome segregation protein Spo0J
MLIKDRIVELKRIKGSQLRPNPKNWRTHSKEQQNAIKGILAEVGFAGACLVRQLEDGSYMLIDGHARTEVSGDAELPCLVLDVTDEEADKILATYDPLGAMAGKDAEKLDELLKSFEMDNAAAQAMLDELARETGINPPDFEPARIEDQGKLDEKQKATCPNCGHEF